MKWNVKIAIDLDDLCLGEVIEFVRDRVHGPEEVFDDDELEKWALDHGWIQAAGQTKEPSERMP